MSATSKTTARTKYDFNPLTTTFSRPQRCSGIWAVTDDSYYMDYDPQCLPPNMDYETSSYFSPGLVCPAGYYTACLTSSKFGTIQTVTCCPTYGEQLFLKCADLGNVVNTVVKCMWSPFQGDTTLLPFTTYTNGTYSTISTLFDGSDAIYAYGIRMIYEMSDLAELQTSYSPETSSTTDPFTFTHESSAAVSATDRGSPYTGEGVGPISLSSTTITGIAIGVPLSMLAISALLWFWCRPRRNSDKNQGTAPIFEGPEVWVKTDERDHHEKDSIETRYATSQGRPETSGRGGVGELPAHEVTIHELPAVRD